VKRMGNEKIIVEVGREIWSRTEVADVRSSLLSGGGGHHGRRMEVVWWTVELEWWILDFGWCRR